MELQLWPAMMLSTSRWKSAGRVGYLPETVPLYTDMTAVDYLQFMADLRHIPHSKDRAYEALKTVGWRIAGKLYRQFIQRHAPKSSDLRRR